MNFLHIFLTIIFTVTFINGRLIPCNACQDLVKTLKISNAPQQESFFTKIINMIFHFLPKFSKSNDDSGKEKLCTDEITKKHLNGKEICQKIEGDIENVRKMLSEGKSARDVCQQEKFC